MTVNRPDKPPERTLEAAFALVVRNKRFSVGIPANAPPEVKEAAVAAGLDVVEIKMTGESLSVDDLAGGFYCGALVACQTPGVKLAVAALANYCNNKHKIFVVYNTGAKVATTMCGERILKQELEEGDEDE